GIFALGAALLWAVHPLQTESVTYVVQRAESLAGLLSLLTLYCFIRGVTAPARTSWFAGSVISFLVGVGQKGTGALMPIIALLYDRTFVAGTFYAAWRARRGVYLALLATWVPLAALVLGGGGNRGGTFAFTPEGFWNYWVAQLKAVTYYLRLVVWP